MSAGRSVALVAITVFLAGGSGAPIVSAVPARPAAPAPAPRPAAPAAAADPVKDQLDTAKAKRAADRAKAQTALIAAIDAQIKTAGAAGDLDALKGLTSQKDAFVTAGVVPNLPALKD